MAARTKRRDLPSRIATGAFILNSGIEKWRGSPEVAQGVHGMTSTAFPMVSSIPPEKLLKIVAVSEITLGAMLVTPIVPSRVVGVALTGFSAALLVLYATLPGMRRPGSIRPTQQGIVLAKDVWMLGIGLGLVVSD